jgi:hypothetical protein
MNKMLKKFSFAIMAGSIAVLITGCAKQPDKDQVVAQVNNYTVTIDDFKHEAGMSIPGAAKDLILQDIITKELLLQEAQRMDLDKNKLFMKEIEDYWKQSLIKRLISIKGAEFFALAQVSAEEIKAEYRRISEENTGKIKPYAQIAGQIQEKLKIKKAQVYLDNWINSLRKNADIKKYEAVLGGIKLKNAKNLTGGSDGE